MAATFDDAALFEHQNLVGADHGGQPVGDDQGRAVLGDLVQALLDFALGLGVERRGRLVEHQDRRTFENSPADGDALLLAARELEPALADRGIVAVGQRLDEIVNARHPGGTLDLVPGRPGIAVGKIVEDRVVEQHGVLGNDADRRAQGVLGDVADVFAVDEHAAAGHVVEPEQDAADRRLAGTARADDGDRLAGGHGEAHVLEDRPPRIVTEIHVVEHDLTAGHLERPSAGPVDHVGFGMQQVEHDLEVD